MLVDVVVLNVENMVFPFVRFSVFHFISIGFLILSFWFFFPFSDWSQEKNLVGYQQQQFMVEYGVFLTFYVRSIRCVHIPKKENKNWMNM